MEFTLALPLSDRTQPPFLIVIRYQDSASDTEASRFPAFPRVYPAFIFSLPSPSALSFPLILFPVSPLVPLGLSHTAVLQEACLFGGEGRVLASFLHILPFSTLPASWRASHGLWVFTLQGAAQQGGWAYSLLPVLVSLRDWEKSSIPTIMNQRFLLPSIVHRATDPCRLLVKKNGTRAGRHAGFHGSEGEEYLRQESTN